MSIERTELAPPRRRVLAGLASVLGLAALAECVWIALQFLRPRRDPARDRTEVIVAGPVDRFAPGSVALELRVLQKLLAYQRPETSGL